MVSLALETSPRLAVVDEDEVDVVEDDAVEAEVDADEADDAADADGGDSSTERSQYELTFCPSSHTSR